jgi:hypothetical protein
VPLKSSLNAHEGDTESLSADMGVWICKTMFVTQEGQKIKS